MLPVSSCLICGSPDLARVPATVAPFLGERCGLPAELELYRCHCPDCDVAFFDQRLDPDEVARLYRDYRGPAYHARREHWEPGWLASAGALDDRGNPYHRTRVQSLAALMARWQAAPAAVLDYGGEEDAWLARGAFPAARVQGYDISGAGRAPEPPFDLVLCAHVLEHVSFPLPFLRDLVRWIRPGGDLYLEVPFEAVDLGATMVPGHPLNRMHEHVSWFSPRALQRLLAASGLAPRRVLSFRNPFYRATAVLAGTAVAGVAGAEETVAEVSAECSVEQEDGMDAPLLGSSLLGIHQAAQGWIREQARIVVYPAGAHSMELLAYTALGQARVLALSDRDPALRDARPMGLPVVPPERIPELRPDLVLIASPRFEADIARDLAWLEAAGIRRVLGSRYSGRLRCPGCG